MIPKTSPDFYLSRVADELVVKTGKNPVRATAPKQRVLIIGGGVTGLTTAWALLDAGYDVTILSEKWASLDERITSQIAGALWEWPPAVCGKHTDTISLHHSKRWCMTSYHAFDKLQQILPAGDLPQHGVAMRMANFFFDRPVHDMPDELEKMNEIATHQIKGFRHDPTLIAQHAVNQKAGVVDSYQHVAPVIDTDRYMTWLRFTVACRGGRFVTGRVNGDLLDQEDALLRAYGASAIVNATGLSGLELAGDMSVYPLRGALVRVINDGSKFPLVTEALCVTHDDAHGAVDDIVFIVPRNDRTLILGGLAQPNVHTLDLTLDSPEIKLMRLRCNNFVPGLENAEYDPDAALVQGLRPLRSKNVRVERELRRKEDGSVSRIVHSYGHGGSGFSLSFGCASDVLSLLMQLEAGIPPSPMSVAPQEIMPVKCELISDWYVPKISGNYRPRTEMEDFFSRLRLLAIRGKSLLRIE